MSDIPVRPQDNQPGFITEGEVDPLKLVAGPFLPPPAMEQNEQEFYWMLAQIGRPKSILEIGSREGGMLKVISAYLEPGARICCIDIGERHPEWQNGRDTVPHLRDALIELKEKGFDVNARIGDSQMASSVEWAKSFAPFDVVFIDGDHSYAAAKNDLLNYGPMAKIAVAIHDIGMTSIAQLWAETTGLMANLANGEVRNANKMQMIASNSSGIGIIKFET